MDEWEENWDDPLPPKPTIPGQGGVKNGLASGTSSGLIIDKSNSLCRGLANSIPNNIPRAITSGTSSCLMTSETSSATSTPMASGTSNNTYNRMPMARGMPRRMVSDMYGDLASDTYGDLARGMYGDLATGTYGDLSTDTYGDLASGTSSNTYNGMARGMPRRMARGMSRRFVNGTPGDMASGMQTHLGGKIFGSRGRGFIIPPKPNIRIGRWFAESQNGQRDHRRGCGGRFNSNWDFRRRRSDNFDQRRNFDRRGENGSDWPRPRPRSTYIPDEPTEDDNEIFGNSISTGINFGKFDQIAVKVSGENVPLPITSFETAGLRRFMVDLIKKCKYVKPTPVQKYSIPIILQGRDIMACAQTGSGKTAAYLIPVINRLLEDKEGVDISCGTCPQAVIVCPTRELTIQIFNETRKFSRGSVLKSCLAYGGTVLFNQLVNIKKGCNILVTTPGRLLDFVGRGIVNLIKLKYVVLDEADRMLDLGFFPDMKNLLNSPETAPAGYRQTLMFSATFPEEIQRVAGNFLNDYLFLAVGIVGGACTDVEQRFFCVTKFEKRNRVVDLVSENVGSKCLIFVEQKRTTDFIATFLCEKNFPATSIHGDREQREREEALRDFKSGRMNILVATSVAARGLDIKNVAHVINFDLPKNIDEYVHRIGRTGRVGNRGLATSFYDPERDRLLAPDLVKILRQAGQPVPNFLRNLGFGGTYDGPSSFAGSDFRECDIACAQGSTYEQENW